MLTQALSFCQCLCMPFLEISMKGIRTDAKIFTSLTKALDAEVNSVYGTSKT